jgi:hypothetical protein
MTPSRSGDRLFFARPISPVDVSVLKRALVELDREIDRPLELLVGGGAALALAHGVRVSTLDVDAVPFRSKLALEEIGPAVARVGEKLGLGPTWLNGWYGAFLHVLPPDFETRLVTVHHGERLRVHALGAEDLVVMKLFAGRDRDLPHARALLAKGADVRHVEARLRALAERSIPGAEAASERLADLQRQLGS